MKNTPQSINRTINGLKEKLEIHKYNEEVCKTINLVLKRVKIYISRIYEKKDIYLNIMNERNVDNISISFPTTC